MPNIKNSADLGRSIRAARKVLGWDQARLAEAIGASRQWVIDIEKGKPRAELERVLRALDALGLDVYVTSAVAEPQPGKREHIDLDVRPPGTFDIDKIIDRYRRPSRLGLLLQGAPRSAEVNDVSPSGNTPAGSKGSRR